MKKVTEEKDIFDKIVDVGAIIGAIIFILSVIYAGYVEIPELSCRHQIKADTRKGVAVEYLTEPLPA